MGLRLSLVACLMAALIVLFVPDIGAGLDPDPFDRDLDLARTALIQRDLPDATNKLRAIISAYPKHNGVPEVRILLARALLLQKDSSAAVDVLANALKETNLGEWTSKGRYLLSRAVMEAGDSERASQIYREEASRLTGEKRLKYLAERYVQLGEEFSKPVRDPKDPLKPERPADFGKAYVFFREAETILAPHEHHAQLTPRMCESLLQQKKDSAAIALAKGMAKQSEPEGPSPDPQLNARSHFFLARGYLALKNREAARGELLVLSRSPLSAEKEFEETKLLLGYAYGLPSPRTSRDLRAGLAAWSEFLHDSPSHKKCEVVRRLVVQAQVAATDEDAVEVACRDYLAAHGEDKNAPGVFAQIVESRVRRGDHPGARKAIAEFLKSWPDDPAAPTFVKRLPLLTLEQAVREKSLDKQREAIRTLEGFLATYAAHGNAPDAAVELGRILLEIKEPERAFEAWSRARVRYRTSDAEQAALAGFLSATVLEEKLNRLEDAVKRYQEVARLHGKTSSGRSARSRLSRMKSEVLELSVDRVFSSKDTPTIALTTRNIEEIKFKVLPLSFEDWFRDRQTLIGFENLDVTLVSPKKTWEWKVPDYEKYRRHQTSIPLKDLGPGTWLVSVEDGKRRSLVAVVVSDVRLLVKQSAHQCFVFAYDPRTNENVENARILVADGGQIVAEGSTGKDGVWRQSFDKPGKNRQILALKGPHVAPGCIAKTPKPSAFGYSDNARLTSDRSVYRPGSSVHFRGLARQAKKGQYQVPPVRESVRIQVRDARGVLVLDQAEVLDEHGVCSTEWQLSPEASKGEYVAGLVFRDTTFKTRFEVKEFQTPECRARVREKTEGGFGVSPGSSIPMVVDVRDIFGVPLSGVDVSWEVWSAGWKFDASPLKDDAWLYLSARSGKPSSDIGDMIADGRGTANEKGVFEFTFDTPLVTRDRIYTVFVRAVDKNLAPAVASTSVFATHESYFGMIRSHRKVCKVGDTISVEVATVGPGLDPVPQTGVVRLLLKRKGDQGMQELSRSTLSTGADGRGKTTLKATEAGELSLVFEGSGSRGEDISFQSSVLVTDTGIERRDDVRLTATRKVWREGETLTALLEAPKDASPVLITFEGNRVLEHVVLRPSMPTSEVSMMVRAEHAPNVFFAATCVAGDKLRTSIEPLVVLRYLNVEITAEKSEYTPGSTAALTVKTTDQVGNPLSACLGIWVVDQALDSVAKSKAGDILSVFLNTKRNHTVVTSATSLYRYKGRTSGIDADLLAEAKKRSLGEKAKEARRRMDVAARLKFGDFDKDVAGLERSSETMNDAIGLGGGAGGAFGGRRGGRSRSRKSYGGPASPKSKNSIANKYAEDRPFFGAELEEQEEVAPREEVQSLGLFRSQIRLQQQTDYKQSNEGLLNMRLLASNRALQLLDENQEGETRQNFRDLAFFSARVITNEKGVATIDVDLPDNLTIWNVHAEGATASTHVGGGKGEIKAKKPLSVQLALPPFMTHKDRSNIGIQVVNRSGEELDVDVAVGSKATDLADVDSSNRTRERTLKDGGRLAWQTTLGAKQPGSAQIEALATAGVISDRVLRSLSIEAFGKRHVTGGSGVATESGRILDVNVGDDVIPGTGRIAVMLYSDIASELVDSIAWLSVVRRSCLEESVNRFRPALTLATVLDRLGMEAPVGSDSLEQQGRNGLRRLLDSQNNDGGFALWSRGITSAYPTAMALETFELAGHLAPVDMPLARKRAQKKALAMLADPRTPKDAAAYLEYALSLDDKGDVEGFNRLMRHTKELSQTGLAWLLMAAGNMNREVQAQSIQRQLLGGIRTKNGTNVVHSRKGDSWLASQVEASAWTLKALLARGYTGVKAAGLARGLRASRKGMSFGGSKATGAAVEALSAWIETQSITNARGEVSVLLNGVEVPNGKVSFGGEQSVGGRALDVPFDLMKAGSKNRFTIRSSGIEDVRFVVLARWTQRAETMTAEASGFAVRRTLTRHIPMSERAKLVRDGYSIINKESRPEVTDPPEELSLFGGRYYTVTLDVETDLAREFVVLEDPLPAGVDVIDTQVTGTFDHFELNKSSISFYFSRVKKGKTRVRYTIRATRTGVFHVASANASGLYDPEYQGSSSSSVVNIAESIETSARLAPSQKTPDALRLRGLREFERDNWEEAVKLLSPLLEEDLRTNYRNELSRAVFLARLRSGKNAAAIRDFEERIGPFGLDQNLPRADVMLLGDAYHGADDFEQARSLFARVVADCFGEETQWSNHLSGIGRPIAALTDLWRSSVSWPDTLSVQREWFRSAETWFSIVDPSKKKASLPEPLKRFNERGFAAIRQAMSHHAGGALEEAAGFGLLRRFGDLGLIDRIEAESNRFVKRHPKSPRSQDAQAMLMRASFQLRHYEQSGSAANRLLKEKWVRQRRNTRRPEKSVHVDEARYTLGMIAHVKGDVRGAVDHYAEVRGKFPDAEQSWLFFNEKRLSLPELSVVTSGNVDLKMTTKNLKKIECSLYRVDLGLVFAVKKSLGQINRVDLVGIDADRKWETEVDAGEFVEHTGALSLGDLSEGAWLLVVRGGGEVKTILVVVSTLRVTLQRTGSDVRAYVTDSTTGKPVAGAELRFGDGNRIVATGETDDRGILSLAGLPGGLTVLAAKGNAYALNSEK